MKTIKELFPKFNVRTIFATVTQEEVGHYNFTKDIIVLSKEVRQEFPMCRDIIFLHEMFHSTAASHRSMRMMRLLDNFDPKLAYRVEECIAEICTLVACSKMGILNTYSKIIIEDGLGKNYGQDIFIPWREVVACVNYFKSEDEDFTEELNDVKLYLELNFEMKIEDTYAKSTNQSKAV